MLAAALAVSALLADDAAAQGFFGSAGVSVDQGYESNLFATADGHGPGSSDLILRVGPSVEAGYRTPRVDLLGRYTIGTERYGENTALNRRIGQHDARAELGYWPNPRLGLGGSALYMQSYTPSEIISGDSLVRGRLPASRLLVMPAVSYDFNPDVTLAAEYEFAREGIADQTAALVHTPHIGLNLRASPRTTWRVLYRARRFGPPGARHEMTQAWLVGLERNLARFVDLEIQAGPRLFSREVRPEVSATIRRRFRRGEVFLSASETETTMIGEQGILNVRSARVGTTLQIARYVTITATPTLFRTWRGDATATVRAIDFEAVAHVARGVSVVVSGLAANQRSNFGGPIETVPTLNVRVGIRVLYPGRPRAEVAQEEGERRNPEDSRRPGLGAR
jgi:hypothetical protein